MTYVDLFFKIVFESLMMKPNFIYFFMPYFQYLKNWISWIYLFSKNFELSRCISMSYYSSNHILSLFFQSYIILILPIVYYPYSSYHILSLFFQSHIILILPYLIISFVYWILNLYFTTETFILILTLILILIFIIIITFISFTILFCPYRFGWWEHTIAQSQLFSLSAKTRRYLSQTLQNMLLVSTLVLSFASCTWNMRKWKYFKKKFHAESFFQKLDFWIVSVEWISSYCILWFYEI